MHRPVTAATVSPAARRGEFADHWKLLVPCFVGIMLAAVTYYTTGVMMGPIEAETGWSRAEISSGMTINAIVGLVAAPVVGIAVDRVGPRRVALFGIVTFCAALAGLSTATASIWSWWLLWFLLSIGTASIGLTVWASAINHSFFANRGLALAIILCGGGFAATVYPVLTETLIQAYGWRGAYVALAGAMAAISLPSVFFLFRSSADQIKAVQVETGQPGQLPGYSRSEGLRRRSFWQLACAMTLFMFAANAMIINGVPLLVSQGLERVSAAYIAGFIGIGSIAGRIGGGLLLDRFDANRVAAASVLAPVATAVILLTMPGSQVGSMIAFALLGLSVGAELDMCAYLASRHLGIRNFGTLFGIILSLIGIGSGLSPVVSNYVYDVTGTYLPLLWTMLPACLVSAALLALLGPYPEFDHTTATEH